MVFYVMILDLFQIQSKQDPVKLTIFKMQYRLNFLFSKIQRLL